MQINMILLKVVAVSEVSQRSKEGLAQLHRSSHPSKTPQHFWLLKNESMYDITVILTRFYALIKLDKVETEEEMKVMLENLPNEYAAMLGQ